jgi:uncharacterized ion transporter superfamily protein YfcC
VFVYCEVGIVFVYCEVGIVFVYCYCGKFKTSNFKEFKHFRKIGLKEIKSSEKKWFMSGCTVIQKHRFVLITVLEVLMCFMTTVKGYYTNYNRRYHRISR